MKNTDDAIERVLTGLRDVESPAGMERRILAAMEDRAGAGVGWRLPLWLVAAARAAVVRYVVMGCAAAGVVALVLAIPASHRLVRAPMRGKGSVAEKQVSPLPLRQAQGPVEMTASGLGRNDGSRTSAEKRVSPLPLRQAQGPIEMTASLQGGDEDSYEVAMSETRAASFPAPPMPLTEQERLLLRMVHRGEPVELAMLDPRIVAMRDAEEKAESRQVSAIPVAKDAAADGSGVGQMGAGAAQSYAEPAAESVAGPAAEGASPAGTMEQTAPVVANPEQPNVKDGLRQQITTVEKE